MLNAFGFGKYWIKWIMRMIKSYFFLILMNGSPSNHFFPYRGIRQEDLLSPFMFILMDEGLSHNFSHSKVVGQLKGLSFSFFLDVVSHLQFQFFDEKMLLGVASIKEAKAFKLVLDTFLLASCVLLNDSKSSILFFHTREVSQRNISIL